MSKKLFFSCFSGERSVAKVLMNNLGYAFKNNLRIESPLEDMKCGDDWKDYIKSKLEECDGLITLITPAYAKRPWCIAEFVPFWMSEKKVFPVAIGFQDIAMAEVFTLITEKQVAHLENSNEVQGLLERIADFCGDKRPDVSYLTEIVDGCVREYNGTIAKERALEQGIPIERVVFFESDMHVKKYRLNATTWACAPNPEDSGILSTVCTKDLHFISNSNNLQYLEMPFRALSDEGVDFEIVEVEADGRKISFSELVKGKGDTVYSYQIRFKPALRENDTVRIKYTIAIPQYKFATSDKAFEYYAKNGKRHKDSSTETTAMRVITPTDEMRYRIIFSPDCEVTLHEVQPQWITSKKLNLDEMELLRSKKECYSVAYVPKEGCVVSLTRKNPPVGLSYTFTWDLPNGNDD